MPPITSFSKKDFKDHPLLNRLLSLHDTPNQLHVIGELPEVTIDAYGRATPRILTIVGSRKNTTYGKQALESLVRGLAGQPVIILSGLALGIDGLAHNAALTNNLTTIAIPGSGLHDRVLYPRAHLHLAKDIIAHHGILLSELEPGAQAAQWTFPMRNRIMAALSDAILIVEAEEKSGTLITARLALELGKDIGAIPGEIFSPTSTGTNMLIKEGAYAITSTNDLLDLLHLSSKENHLEQKSTKHLSEQEQKVLELLNEPKDKDVLLAESGLPLTQFLSAFSSLEINGYLQESFGEVRRIV